MTTQSESARLQSASELNFQPGQPVIWHGTVNKADLPATVVRVSEKGRITISYLEPLAGNNFVEVSVPADKLSLAGVVLSSEAKVV